MADHELPEDVRRWPTDPYELLGVTYSVLPRDLKRSYTRLIRAYKPEQHPEEFRLIREAYEKALRWVSYRSASDESTGDEEQTPTAVDAIAHGEALASSMPSPASPPMRSVCSQVDDLWEQAVQGQSALAYDSLRNLSWQNSTNGDICLRLYWLLALSPELDQWRLPFDWLAAGLRTTGLTGPMRELLRREVASDPTLAFNEAYTDFWPAARQPALVFDLVQWRWHAAAWRDDLVSVVKADLERLRPQVQHADEETWTRLLMMALDLVAWLRDKPALEFTSQLFLEIDRHEHLHLRLPNEFMRVDLLRELSRGCRKLSVEERISPALLGLLAASWWQPFDDVRSTLVANLGHMSRHPIEAMQAWDHVRKEAPGALAHFGGLLDQLEYRLEGPYEQRSAELVSAVVLDLAAETYWRAYPSARSALLTACIREDIPPRTVAEVCAAHEPRVTGMPPDVPQQIADDWVVEIVYRGCRLFALC